MHPETHHGDNRPTGRVVGWGLGMASEEKGGTEGKTTQRKKGAASPGRDTRISMRGPVGHARVMAAC